MKPQLHRQELRRHDLQRPDLGPDPGPSRGAAQRVRVLRDGAWWRALRQWTALALTVGRRSGGGLQAIPLLLLALCSGALQAQVVSGTNTGPIPDGGLPGVTGPNNFGPPRDVRFNVTGRSGTVQTLTVGFEASHTFVGDLRVTLISMISVTAVTKNSPATRTKSSMGRCLQPAA